MTIDIRSLQDMSLVSQFSPNLDLPICSIKIFDQFYIGFQKGLVIMNKEFKVVKVLFKDYYISIIEEISKSKLLIGEKNGLIFVFDHFKQNYLPITLVEPNIKNMFLTSIKYEFAISTFNNGIYFCKIIPQINYKIKDIDEHYYEGYSVASYINMKNHQFVASLYNNQ